MSQRGIGLVLLLAASFWPQSGPADPETERPPQVEPPPLALELGQVRAGRSGNWVELNIHVLIGTPEAGTVTVEPRVSEGITVKPASTSFPVGGAGQANARFRIHDAAGAWRTADDVSFIAKLAMDGASWQSDIAIQRPALTDHDRLFHAPSGWFIAILAALLGAFWYRARLATGSRPRRWGADARLLADVAVLLAVEAFIVSQLSPGHLITSTITTGGDTGSHYYTLQYLRDELLPQGSISGWTPGNYAGFPILQFYFPLNFLMMVFLSGIVTLPVAFKLGSLAGTLLLPVAVYGFLRMVRCPFPGPGIGAALALPFLFNASQSMWGGNILSNLAGEFSYGLSMALSLLLLGSLYRGIREDSGVIRNALLVFLVGFSHGYTLLFAEAMSLFLLITPRGFVQRVFYLGRVYALAFCLLAFWLVPLLVFTPYTTPYDLAWTIDSYRDLIPPLLVPTLLAAAAGTLGLLAFGIWRLRTIGLSMLPVVAYLWFGVGMTAVFFAIAPRIGVVDIRYVPYGHLLGILLAALAMGWLGWSLRRWKADWLLLPAVAVLAIGWILENPGPVSEWSRWNYEGLEAKATWPVFDRVNQSLRGDFQDPRVVFEHSDSHNAFGTTRAFESLPLFAGRATLEGLYMQASISAPFVFYIQSEISQQKSVPFPQYSYSNMNFDRARPHLELFNARDLIIRSAAAKRAIRLSEGYRLRETIGDYELWELTTATESYVVPLDFEPVLFPTDDWKQVSHRWFKIPATLENHLVFTDADVAKPFAPFKTLTRSLDGIPPYPIDGAPCSATSRLGNQWIEIDTDCIGRPLLIRMSYHPNWHVTGAERIWLASPSFMLVYPQQNNVRLEYGPGPWDRLGGLLTLGALLVLLLNIPLPVRGTNTGWQLIAGRLRWRAPAILARLPDPAPGTRRTVLIAAVAAFGVTVAGTAWHLYQTNPNRIYNRAIQWKDAQRYAEAREGFLAAGRELGSSDLAQNAAYYIAITYHLEQRHAESIAAFEELISRFPDSNWVPESEYHIGLNLLASGRERAGIERLKSLTEQHPGTRWAEYAAQRLLERGETPEGFVGLTRENVGQYMSLGINHFNHDRLAEAHDIMARITADYPDYDGAPQALAVLALTYYKQGDCAGTGRHYRDLIERYPDDALVAEAWYHLGLCAEHSGDGDAARQYFQQVVGNYPDSRYAAQARERLSQ